MKTIITKTILAVVLINLMACVQKTHHKTIHFKVDTNTSKNLTKIGIRGEEKPLSWEETIYMNDADGDGVYELTLEFNSASPGIEFKFVNQNGEFELEDKDNRQLPFQYRPEIISYETTFNTTESSVSSK